jgi:uncharacterized protein YceK
MKYVSILFFSILILGMGGCASMDSGWIPPQGKTQADYSTDYAECRLQWSNELDNPHSEYLAPDPDDYRGAFGVMKANAEINPFFLKECMEKKGWVKKEDQ